MSSEVTDLSFLCEVFLYFFSLLFRTTLYVYNEQHTISGVNGVCHARVQ